MARNRIEIYYDDAGTEEMFAVEESKIDQNIEVIGAGLNIRKVTIKNLDLTSQSGVQSMINALTNTKGQFIDP